MKKLFGFVSIVLFLLSFYEVSANSSVPIKGFSVESITIPSQDSVVALEIDAVINPSFDHYPSSYGLYVQSELVLSLLRNSEISYIYIKSEFTKETMVSKIDCGLTYRKEELKSTKVLPKSKGSCTIRKLVC